MTNMKTTKRALLTSVMALLLCFSMLLGTTYAWFTDSVVSTNNIITSGNLDVELEYSKDGEKWETLTDASNVFSTTYWEPGRTEVVYFRVSNLGTLSLKYKLGINIASEKEGTNVFGETFKLSQYIMVGVDEKYDGQKDSAYESRTEAIAAASETGFSAISNGYAKTGKLDPKEASAKDYPADCLALVVYMPETVDNQANYKTGTEAPSINLGIMVLATQLDAEMDSFGSDYDEDAKYLVSPDEEMIFFGTNFENGIRNEGTLELNGGTVEDGIVNEGTLNVTDSTVTSDNRGFENYGEATLENVNMNAGSASEYANVSIGEDSKTVYNNFNLVSKGGGIGASDGAKVIFNSGKVVMASPSTSGRYIFYTVGAGSEITINGGEFEIAAKLENGNPQNGRRAYIYAGADTTVYITGGTFGKASTRADYTAGILGQGTVIITGGTFGFDPTQWVAGGYEAVKNGSTWTVQPTDEDIATILTSNEEHIVVTLTENVDLPIASLGSITAGSGEYKLGGENTKTITIDLNGKKLNITTTYWSAIGAVNPNATITIKNGNMTSTGNSAGTWNAFDLRFSNCDYVIDNVVFEKAVAFDNAGKSVTINDVTIKETHDYYAMWITAEGQNVVVDGLTIESSGRGIKIDEQYVSSPSKVTLSVSNSNIVSAKKGAIMVKSPAGAYIALNNVNIENTIDATNAVWIDEDSESYADLVTVTGGTKINESAVITSTTALNAALSNGQTELILAAGEYDVNNGKNKTLTITGLSKKAVITVVGGGQGEANGQLDYGFDSSNVTFKNVTIKTNNQTYAGYARLNGTYENCVFENCYSLNGTSSFTDCIFNVSGNQYNIWTWGAPEATFTGCTFNSDGKAILLYGMENTKLTLNQCIFNDTGVLPDLKAAVEIGNDYNKSYELIANDVTVNGYEINDKGINTGTTLWGNKNSMGTDKLNVVVDGVDVY